VPTNKPTILERDVQRKIKDALAKIGAHKVIKLTTLGRYGTKGLPDLLVLGPQRFVMFMEVKVPGNQSTPLQLHSQAELRALGFPVYEVDNVRDAVGFYEEEVESWLAKFRDPR
jgi:hypothetical protein